MGEPLEIVWPEHNSYLCEEMWRLFNCEDGQISGPSDLKISCHDSDPFTAHSIILKIFCQNLVDSNSTQIVFEDTEIKKNDLQSLMEFMYLGKTCLDKRRLKVIRRAAEQLGLVVFVNAIDDVLANGVPGINEEYLNSEEIEKSNSEGRTCEKTEADENVDTLFEGVEENLSSNEMSNHSEENNKTDLERRSCEKRKFYEKLEISPVTEENLSPNKKLKKSEEISTNSSEPIEKESETISQDEIRTKNLESGSKSQEKLIKDSLFDKDVVCAFCDKIFKDKYRYAEHLKSHTKPSDSSKCPHCSYRGKLLEKHMNTVHQLDKDGKSLKKLFACNICKFKCIDQFQLMGHARQKHGTREFKCDHCTYVCYNNWRLERHLKHMHFVTSESSKETLGASKLIPGGSKAIHGTSQVTPRISVVAPGISVVKSGTTKATSGISTSTQKIVMIAPGISIVSSKIENVTLETLEESSEMAFECSEAISKISNVILETPKVTPEIPEERSRSLEEGSQVLEEGSVVVEQIFHVIEMSSGVMEEVSEVIEMGAEGLEESSENSALDSRPFKCDTCGACYKTAAYLKSHAEIHLGKVVCEICGASLAFKSLQKHKKMVHREDTEPKTFQCHLCSVTFSANEYLKCHLKKVHTEKRFKCETCGALFKTPWGVTSHSEIHSERIKCDVCGKSLTQRSLGSHMNLIHGDDLKTNPPTVFKCSICSFSTRVQSLLKRHVTDIHPANRNYPCQVCGMRFKNKKGLDCHSAVHQERVTCTFCGKSLSQRCVPSHMKVFHSGKKPSRPMTATISKCPLNNCDFKSNYRSNLKKHLRKRHRLGKEEVDAFWDKSMEELNAVQETVQVVEVDDSSVACASISTL